MTNKKILLVGGGTGGHIVPIFELYQSLKSANPDLDIKVIGGDSEVEKKFFHDNADFVPIETGKMHRRFTLRNLIEATKYFKGRSTVGKIVASFKPDLIFSKGGYVSLPVIYWANKLKIPYFIHESDIEMGESNKYAAKNATKVFVGFPTENYKNIAREKLIQVGQFISSELFEQKKHTTLFHNEKPTILVTGGSQGAAAINQALISSAPSLLKSYNVIHQTGDRDFEKVKTFRDSLEPSLQERYLIKDFFLHQDGENSIYTIYQSSDLFVGRASITFPAEAAVAGLPLILIPYPYAASDHQLKNGLVLQDAGVCVLIEQKELTPARLTREVDELMADRVKYDRMVAQAKEFFGRGALPIITESILNEIEK